MSAEKVASASAPAATTPPASARRPGRPRQTAAGRLADGGVDVRERILATASRLFYAQGVRAVGVDLVVLEAAVAKTSLYRYFPTKDDLIVAFLEREDLEFWAQWDGVAARFADDPVAELDAQLRWIAERLARANYRGCPQINVAAEFAEQEHPARQVARQHMQALRERLLRIAQRIDAKQADLLAAQLGVLVNGAFVSASLLRADEAEAVLCGAAKALLAAARA